MCASIVDIENIAHINFRQHTVDCKLIVIFAQTACYVIFMVAGCVFLPQNSNMVIGAVHSRTHQICRAGIQSDVFLIGMLFMDGSCNQCAVGSQHKASHFGKDGNIAHACRCQNFFVYPSYPFADCHDVTFKFIGFVRNADPTGKVDKCNMNIQLVFQLHGQFKNNLR